MAGWGLVADCASSDDPDAASRRRTRTSAATNTKPTTSPIAIGATGSGPIDGPPAGVSTANTVRSVQSPRSHGSSSARIARQNRLRHWPIRHLLAIQGSNDSLNRAVGTPPAAGVDPDPYRARCRRHLLDDASGLRRVALGLRSAKPLSTAGEWPNW